MTRVIHPPRGRRISTWGAGAVLRQGNVAVGNFFFRYRNALFPVVFVLVVPFMQPRLMFNNSTLDRLLATCGALVALAGEFIRLVTIGYEYIERGGKEGKVYASHLVEGGVYALTRNPMYVGNALIAIGMTMIAGSPLVYSIVLPFFLFVYQAIVSAEEGYLRGRFGKAYDQYCARVNRFLPALHHVRGMLCGMRYDWRRAVRKELSTIAGLLIGFILLPIWRVCWLRGWAAAKAAAPRTLVLVLAVLLLYGLFVRLKRSRQLFYEG